MKDLIFILTALVLVQEGFAQTASQTRLDSLESELTRTRVALKYCREQANNLYHLQVAKEMALRSGDQVDPAVQALTAVQAYIYSWEYGGNPSDIEIYKALFYGLNKFSDSICDSLSNVPRGTPDQVSEALQLMANRLCSKVKRNMTVEEWDVLVGRDLAYQSTCPCITLK